MQINSESCVYVEHYDMVYGDQGYANTSQWHEAVYYSSPLDVFDNEADYSYPNGGVYTYDSTYYQDPNLSGQNNYFGAPQSSSFSGGYVFDSQDQSYDYGTYHYEFYPVYYVYPTYPGYYALTNPEYSPENVYSAYYVYVPVNIYYYVPYFVYYLPTSTDNIIYDVDSTQSYESDVLPSSMEQCFDDSQEFNSNFYNIGSRSSADTLDNCNEIVGKGITTCELFYEYPETLNDAPVDDEEKKSCINTYDSFSKIVGEEMTTGRLFYEVYPVMLNNAGVDDEDKSVSSNEKLENDAVSSEAEVNANITVNEESCSIEKDLCEDDMDRNLIKKISSMSIDDVKEDIDDNYENAKAFVYSEVLKGYTEIKNMLEELEYECHSLEDILEEEEPESGSDDMDFNENVADDLQNITLLADEDEESNFTSASFCGESQVDSNAENLVEDHEIMMEGETQPSADPLDAEEKDETDPFLELCLIKENLHSVSLESIEEHHLPMASSAIQGKDETSPLGPKDSIEVVNPPVASLAIQGKDKRGPFLEEYLGKEELYSGPVNSIEEHHSPEDSSVAEENYKMDKVPQLSLTEDKFDSGSRSSLEELHTKMSSEDRGEEGLHSAPDMSAPAAAKAVQRKKRFSGLRKFLARLCCCAKKRS